MPHFIAIRSIVKDSRAESLKRHLENIGFKGKIHDIALEDIYTIDKKFTKGELQEIAKMLTNPVIETSTVAENTVILSHTVILSAMPAGRQKAKDLSLKNHRKRLFALDPSVAALRLPQDDTRFTWVIEKGFLPGVTDNVAHTVKQGIEDLFKIIFEQKKGVYTSQTIYLTGKLARKDAENIARELVNPLIQRVHVKSPDELRGKGGIGLEIPKVSLKAHPKADEVSLDIPENDLAKLGKEGIRNADGTRQGPLALSLRQLITIRDHFKKLNRNPTDIELESLAQTWSEHCKHTIFSAALDEIKEGLYQRFIKGATEKIRREKGSRDFCVSVFKDNSGAITFDKDFLITHKVETHNTPSALDPYGGAITGIVGVNRDTIGFGLGAKPIMNYYGFCFANPSDEKPLFKDAKRTQKMLSPRRILEGVVQGVNDGGNCSGIPTPLGFLTFDERYKGKPLVFVGTVGLIPRKIGKKPSHVKKARPGDYIVMLGGRVGKDGIHGATFSSEAMHEGSPVTAVQIGDPITQKKFSDAIVKEARDLGLYHSITDNGAGGLSCSVAEMARESDGCRIDLEKVPTKYPNLAPWEIWISESQERMTLAVPPTKWKAFSDLMRRRGVEATVIGEFTASEKCVVDFHGKRIFDLSLDFLHNGCPKETLSSTLAKNNVTLSLSAMLRTGLSKGDTEHSVILSAPVALQQETKDLTQGKPHEESSTPQNLAKTLLRLLSSPNIQSHEWISRQYDHEVQSNSVIKPLQGRGRVNGNVAVIKPLYDSNRGIVTSYGIHPSYGDISTYDMAAAAIDTAVRNAIAAGADPDHLSILDNFCWCSANEPYRLGQLKEAARACFDIATAYETPFISGKDSMFNDFKGFDKKGNPVKISIPPTLLISSIGVISDVQKTVSLDFKMPGDLIYILGETFNELGGSEYLSPVTLNRSSVTLSLSKGDQKSTSNVMLRQTQHDTENIVPKVNASKNLALYHALHHAIEKELIASSYAVGNGGLGIALAKMAIAGQMGIDISLKNLPGNTSRDDFALFSESTGRVLVAINPKKRQEFEKIMKNIPHFCLGKVRGTKILKISGFQRKPLLKIPIKTLTQAYRNTLSP